MIIQRARVFSLSVLLPMGLLCSTLLGSTYLDAAQRAETFSEAMEKKGADGIIAYCYGPDWNRRSVRMLESFWARAELATAAGDAVLLSVPFYEIPPTQEELGENTISPAEIQSGMGRPPFNVCPTVMMYDSEGRLYATLVGSDYLGDETGTLGIENITKKLALLRQRDSMMKQARAMPAGAARSKLLIKIGQLEVAAPSDLESLLTEATDAESQKLMTYYKHDPIMFMYEQLETTDGFLKEDFIEDPAKIGKAVDKIADNEHYRPEDRQAARNLHLGALRRDGIAGSRLRNPIRKNQKIAEHSVYGKAMAHLVDVWGKLKSVRKSNEQRRAEREKERGAKKSDRDQDKAQKNISID